MPNSATGTSERPAPTRAGFSLIELLVVLVVIGLVATVAVLRLAGSSPAAEMREELDRLAARIEAQCDRALLQGRPVGLRFGRDGYDFWQIANGGWQPAAGGPGGRSWPDGLAVTAWADQRRLDLSGEPQAPQVLCGPLGELTPLSLELARDGHRARASWTAGRVLTLDFPGPPP